MQFLLERLAQPPSFNGTSQFDLREAIHAQIQRLVGARFVAAGADLDLLDFGVHSVVELGANDKLRLEQYAARIARLIARYEPRLRIAKVQIVPSGDSASPYRLAVSGLIGASDESDVFHFELPSH
ncbi:hypothetical protein PMI16_00444 [Herbaspirillum sp. CF444]|uniref:GPW/gp25 family protein n=1 Tax=Herbaspirillum sp. CF444 TaxID=1144319 RepID=UPI0002726DF2|nr:GPW/gp25 family protein [Herbaspirillum sp. CF444]EJL94089.1 hypothetical protein PMI16_00444 [Herbaspirillum sp. CF444]